MPTGKQTVWTQEEDEMLQRLVQQHGTKKWAQISKKIGTKGGKQCRRRWQNHLSINKNTSGWSPEEDQLLLDAHKRMGNRWTDIAKVRAAGAGGRGSHRGDVAQGRDHPRRWTGGGIAAAPDRSTDSTSSSPTPVVQRADG